MPKTGKKQNPVTSARLDENLLAWLAETFPTPSGGIGFDIEGFRSAYRQALVDLQGVFYQDELRLMLDAMWSVFLTPQILGQHVSADVADSITLEQYDKKWNCDPREKIARLAWIQLATLEIWLDSLKRETAEYREKEIARMAESK